MAVNAERNTLALNVIKHRLGDDVYNYCIANNYIKLTNRSIDSLLDHDEFTVELELTDIKIDISEAFLNSLAVSKYIVNKDEIRRYAQYDNIISLLKVAIHVLTKK